LFERETREKHKSEILEYLHFDCLYLHDLVSAFVERFGPKLTVGATAIGQLMERHEFERMTETNDAYFRQWYFGGRVECFEGGELDGPFKVIDVNSMYPFVMKNFNHPVNCNFDLSDEMPESFEYPFFMRFIGRNRGAIPVKDEDGTLNFNVPQGEFYACSHEIEAALELGLLEIDEVIECAVCMETIRFETFVDDFYKQKVDCKKAGDKIGETFAKFMLNSAYGKFGQNPENFKDWKIVRDYGRDEDLISEGWTMENELSEFELWSKPARITSTAFFDVSIAASITSAARATLLRGLSQATRPIYCDTDSIICQDFSGTIDPTILGAWKFEGQAAKAAIAGKKTYALYDDIRKPVKLACKGGDLEAKDILKMCRGGVIEFHNSAPTFSLKRQPKFITRKFSATVDRKKVAL